MDWSSSLSFDDSEAFASTADTNIGHINNTSGLIDMYHLHVRREQSSHQLEHLMNITLLKLQRASSGRYHSLLRQLLLTCLLQRTRMQTLMRPAMAGYLPHHRHQMQNRQQQPVQQQQLAFEQEVSGAQPSPPMEPSRDGYEWEQEAAFCPGPIAPGLSLDMLLGMGPSQTAVPIAAAAPSMTPSSPGMPEEEQSMYGLGHPQQQSQQQHPLSSIPLASFTNEYPASPLDPAANTVDPYKQQDFSMSLSSIPPLPSTSPMPQHHQLPTIPAIPQQSYYELLMAANPNQPLSQLLSTSATAMASQPFTVASSSISASPDLAPAYSVLDASAPAMVSSSSIPDGTADSSTGLLTPVAPT
ncbi:hypothetical protein BGZ65_006067, partial [Modicella reniformis]